MFRKISIIIILLFLTSCAADMDSIKIGEEDNQHFNPEPNYNYVIDDSYFETKDEALIHYRYYHKDGNNNIIFLLHGEDEILENWNTLADFLIDDIDILTIDIRGYGRSIYNVDGEKINLFDFNEMDYRNLTNDLVEVLDNFDFEKVIFIGSGLGANLVLKSSSEFCAKTTDFLIVTPIIKSTVLTIDSFQNYCSYSNYLYVNENISYEGKEQTKDNVKKITIFTNKKGIDLISNNSLIINQIKSRIKNMK